MFFLNGLNLNFAVEFMFNLNNVIMKKIILIVLLGFLMSNCEKKKDLVVATIDNGTSKVVLNESKLSSLMLKDTFDEELTKTQVSIIKAEDKYYLVAFGLNSENNSRSVGVEVKFNKGQLLIVNRGRFGGKETCSGVNCSYCSLFIGCTCDRAGDDTIASYCNHSIEKESNLSSVIYKSFS
jgi:hypothetical protein